MKSMDGICPLGVDHCRLLQRYESMLLLWVIAIMYTEIDAAYDVLCWSDENVAFGHWLVYVWHPSSISLSIINIHRVYSERMISSNSLFFIIPCHYDL